MERVLRYCPGVTAKPSGPAKSAARRRRVCRGADSPQTDEWHSSRFSPSHPEFIRNEVGNHSTKKEGPLLSPGPATSRDSKREERNQRFRQSPPAVFSLAGEERAAARNPGHRKRGSRGPSVFQTSTTSIDQSPYKHGSARLRRRSSSVPAIRVCLSWSSNSVHQRYGNQMFSSPRQRRSWRTRMIDRRP
jgi:hypothetical protein